MTQARIGVTEASISDAVAAALAGNSAGVLVRAQAGSRRTALIRDAIERAGAETTMLAAGVEMRRGEPFAVLNDLLQQPAAGSGALSDSQFAADQATVDRLVDAVDRAVEAGSVVVVVDDVDMADPLSTHALCVIARTFARRACCVVATLDPGRGAASATRLLRAGLTVVDVAGQDEPVAPGELAELGAETTGVVVTAAVVLGKRFDVEQLSVVTGTTPIGLLASLTRALVAGVLVDTSEQLVFRSTALVSQLTGALSETERCALHEAAADALEAAGASNVAVAHQHVQAAATDGHARLTWLRAAVSEAAGVLPEVVVDLLERAAELESPTTAARHAIDAASIAPLVRMGKVADALARASTLDLDQLAPMEAFGALAGAAMGSERAGSRSRAAELWERAVDLPGLPDRVRAEALAHAATSWLLSAEVARGEALARDAETRARLRGDGAATATAIAALALGAAAAGDSAIAVRRAREAVAIDVAARSSWGGYPRPSAVLGIALLCDDQIDEAIRTFERARRDAVDVGLGATQAQFQWDLALCHLSAGALDDASAAVDAGLAMAEEAETDLGVPVAHAIAARVALHRGEPDLARVAIARADAVSATTGHQLGAELVEWVRALELRSRGERDDARAVLCRGWYGAQALRFLPSYQLMAPDLVRSLVEADDRETLDDVLGAIVIGARRSGADGPRATAALCEALAHCDAAEARRAVELFRRGPRRMALAGALQVHATLLIDAGETREAGSLLNEAAFVYDDCGASGDAADCDAGLRALGIRRRVRDERAANGWDALTTTEIAVVRLVASGLPNRDVADELYVSRHTVESHLRRIFAKLGVRSRVELGRYVARHG